MKLSYLNAASVNILNSSSYHILQKQFAKLQVSGGVALLLFLFFSLPTSIKDAYALTGMVMLFASLVLIFFKQYGLSGLDKKDVCFFGSMALPPLVLLPVAYLVNDRLETGDYQIRILLFFPILLILVKATIDIRWVHLGIAAGTLLAWGVALFHVVNYNPPRVGEHINNVNIYAQVIVMQIIACWLLMLFSKKLLAKCFYMFTFLAGWHVLFLTQTRSAILALIVAMFVTLYLYCRHSLCVGRRALLSILCLSLVLSAVLAFFIDDSLLGGRFSHFFIDLGNYIENGETPSIANRYDVWVATINMWLNGDMVFGSGIGSFKEQLAILIESGQAPTMIAGYPHSHNQALQSLAEGGLVGATLFLISIAVPCYFFLEAFKSNPGNVNPLMGFGVIIVVLLTSMANAIYAHNQIIVCFWMYLVVLWCFSKEEKRKCDNQSILDDDSSAYSS